MLIKEAINPEFEDIRTWWVALSTRRGDNILSEVRVNDFDARLAREIFFSAPPQIGI